LAKAPKQVSTGRGFHPIRMVKGDGGEPTIARKRVKEARTAQIKKQPGGKKNPELAEGACKIKRPKSLLEKGETGGGRNKKMSNRRKEEERKRGNELHK